MSFFLFSVGLIKRREIESSFFSYIAFFNVLGLGMQSFESQVFQF